LENLGAGLINCHILAHSVYRKGEPCYESIVQHFGTEILDDGEEVNRKALEKIVFKSKVHKLEYSTQTGFCSIIKGKAIQLHAWTGPEVSRRLGLSYFKTVGI
jgi:dephospho-CoA kinase